MNIIPAHSVSRVRKVSIRSQSRVDQTPQFMRCLNGKTDLVVVLHQLDDDPDVVPVVLDGDDPHDVGGVLRVRVGAVLVGENQAGVRLVNLGQEE